jgi:hypothetical protein
MATELAPRFQLSAIIRTIFVFFGVFALLNGHAYIGPFYEAGVVRAAFAASWAAVGWNVVCVAGVAIHPYLQRFADRLPFPVKVKVRGRTVLAYGDPDEEGDGFFAPLSGKLTLLALDVVLGTLILVFMLLSRDQPEVQWKHRVLHVEKWILNVWLTLAIFEYVLVVIQSFEAGSIWYKSRNIDRRGEISLLG